MKENAYAARSWQDVEGDMSPVYTVYIPIEAHGPNRTPPFFAEWKYTENDLQVILIHVKCQIGCWILEY